ncbi:Zinc-finger of C2H2 type [Carex littledalei]|uniref:Zinc-finger of C2H2 type n=1 Tax=Carex littledalei TaxID=544730 RepID=A0A833QXV7_9POAL|nr:Zinc-finger of C2H2 type [Carex littledalei]
MEFRYRAFDGVPRSHFYHTSPRFSFALYPPPPPYYDSYFLPPYDAAYAPLTPPPSDHGYFSTHGFRARMLDYRPRGEEPTTSHYPFLPNRPRRDPFLEREYERERIREEVLREEVLRRIIVEEVRRELEMQRYYGRRHPNPGYHETWPAVQYEQPRLSNGCYTTGPRGQVKRKRVEARRRVRRVPHKIVEINEAELTSKPPVSEDKVQPPNEKKIQKKKDEQTVQTKEKGNKVERNVNEISHKIMEVTEEETRQLQALLIDKVQSPKNQEELRPKASLEDKIKPPPNRKNIEKKGDGNKVLEPESGNKVEQRALSKGPLPKEALSKDKITAPSSGKNIEKKGDGNKVLKPESGNKVGQLAFSQSSKELLKEAEACGSKRKCDSISAVPTPATTSNSTDKVSLRRANKQKIDYKEYNCTLCQMTVKGDKFWLGHLNGRRHRNTLERLGSKVQTNKKVNSDMDVKSTSGIGLAAVKELLKEAEACGSKRKCDSISAVPTPATTSNSTDKVSLRRANKQKIDFKEYNCTLCQMTVKGDKFWLGHLNGRRHRNTLERLGSKVQINKKVNSDMDVKSTSGIRLAAVKELLKEAEACGSKRKCDSISAVPTPATTSNRTDKVSLGRAKKQKIDEKEYNCTLCQLTVKGDKFWLDHLNGRRHRKTLKILGSKVQINEKANSDMDVKSTSGIGLAAVKVEMDNADSPVAMPTGEERIVKKMQVGHEVHEVVEKNNRLWCERCRYNCTTTVMMTIHLVSEKHKASSQKQ